MGRDQGVGPEDRALRKLGAAAIYKPMWKYFNILTTGIPILVIQRN